MSGYVKEVAIAGLVVLEAVAMCKGLDGVWFSVIVAGVAGIAGFKISDYVREVKA
jgi:hypothetical protein